MINTIIFDLDDTLLWDNKSVAVSLRETCSYAEEKCGVSASLLEQAIRSEAPASYIETGVYDFTQSIGINPFEGLWGDFDDAGEKFQAMKMVIPGYRHTAWTRSLKKSGVDDNTLARELSEYFPRMRRKNAFVYDDTFQVLEQLKKSYQLVLLTNGSPSLQQTKLEMTPEIAPYFDDIVVSGAFGIGKPDPSIFEFALSKTGSSKAEALMVGDNLMTDILGANRAGIKSVWLNRENKPSHEAIFPDFEIHDLQELVPLLKEL
ncbi:HAD family hydrolase [Planococcus sp. X10-3]|uniref:HAD family hydrolase n=1 Tax=Planococcus sp. X10-3 TaxID=3061240 RepID=UPI003BB17298